MATSKQPRQASFPHPALEVGVAQYPTPFVPDYYTKSGHIILVVKESIEKGNYNPKPLDGSVTYTGRDANIWPSTLYLVYQQPTPDGEYVFSTYANDRTLASQDPWNYGLDYSENNPSFPITSRVYIVPRSQYATVAIGSVDPVFGGTQKIAQQKMVELPDDNPLRSRYVAVQRVYETLPGPTVSGYQYDDFFQSNLSISKQIVVSGATPPSITNGTLSYKDEPIDSIKSQRIIVSTPSLPPTRTEYKTGTYTSPLLVFGIQAEFADFSARCGDGADTRIKLTPNTRASQSRQTVFKTITSYSYGPPASGDNGLLSPELTDVAYTGYVINFNLGGALCDRITAPTIGGAGPGIFVHQCCLPGPICFPYFEYWDILATSPSATQYLGYIGTYKKISWESRYWKANIWESKEIWVKVI